MRAWILPEEQVSFQGVRDPEVSKNGASSLAREMQGFLQPHGGTAPLKINVTGASVGLFPTSTPTLYPAVCFSGFALISFKHSCSDSCVFLVGILQYVAGLFTFNLLAATSHSWCCLLLHFSLEHVESPHLRPEYSREHNWKTQVRPDAVQDKLSSPFPPQHV